jgi:steroid 5-alpha reductase family enzyme
MTMASYLVVSMASVFIYMTFLFLLALIQKDNSIVDVGWGIGFILVWVVTFFLEPGVTARQLLAGGLVLIWASRLAAHIYARNKGRGEDFRYARWRKNWGKWFVPRSFFQVFMLQGFFLLLIAYPVILIARSPGIGLNGVDTLGLFVWLAGFSFETVGDAQLRRFKKAPQNKGRIMTQGLWRLTRHPNYFGESMMWWGIFIISLSAERGWTGVVGPLVITLLLTKISGIPMLEKKYRGNLEFEKYAQKTSAFFPWFPRKTEKG